MAEGVKAHLVRLNEATREHQTGETFVNFMELDAAGEDRVRAAYPPEDFRRLVALKDRHDPDNLFRFNRNIAPSAVAR
jgi:FAD/FMN-containing dehydrogenase